ncbi:MAG: tRNA (adenosine(37)-N6)-dimethylallyltransferase MiaA [Chthoniobacteraceae bacterium]
MSSVDVPQPAGLPPAPPAFYVAGPTGVGKSEYAVSLAEAVGGEIVGADAFQIYAGLPILTAQPSKEQRARVPHHLVAEIPLSENFDVAQYVRRASARIEEIRVRGKVPIVVGGTGLYIRSLVQGMADLPNADPTVRSELEAMPLAELNRKLAKLDPAAAAAIDAKNPRRVIRALEVCLLTGKPFSSFRQEWSAMNAAVAGVVLVREKEELRRRIDARVTEMVREGVVTEVSSAGMMSDTARQVLGFSEIERLLRGQVTEHACTEAIRTQTRQYAKRQMTWFARETWLRRVDLDDSAGQIAEAAEMVRSWAAR